MLSTKPVLPNFLKMLTIALFTVGSVSTFAGHHEAEEAIGEYNEIKAEAMEAEDAVSELTDAEAEATDAATKEVMDAAEELKSEAQTLAEE